MKKISFYLIAALVTTIGLIPAIAQNAESHRRILDEYVKIGLENNLALKEKQIGVEKARLSLREARRLYLPAITFQSDYSLATGGRKIDLPLGDLLNGAYSTLNQLTESNKFKSIENQKVSLLPSKNQDTRFRITAPLINYEIRYANQINKEAINEKRAELAIYKRELIRDIKIAYYSYQQSLKIINVYKNAGRLLQENLRHTETLVKNGVALKTNLLKVQGQILKNTSYLIEAENKSKVAANYFNFLINNSPGTTILIDSTIYLENSEQYSKELQTSTLEREEITRMKSIISESAILVRNAKSGRIPQLGFFLDAGIQGSNFRINSDHAYALGGLQLKWSIYNGSKNSGKVKQAKCDLNILQLKLVETERRIQIENIEKNLELKSAVEKSRASKSRQELSTEFYRITTLQYRQGQAQAIELLDAFTQMLNSQIDYQIDITNILIKQADIERATAAYNL